MKQQNRVKNCFLTSDAHPVEMEDPEGLESKVHGSDYYRFRYEQRKSWPVCSRNQDSEDLAIKGKGIKYADEVIRRKVGKTG